MQFVTLGAFILLFGFFSFNVGSQFRVGQSYGGAIIGLIITNSILSVAGGGITATFIKRFHPRMSKQWSLLTCINGSLAGFVSQYDKV